MTVNDPFSHLGKGGQVAFAPNPRAAAEARAAAHNESHGRNEMPTADELRETTPEQAMIAGAEADDIHIVQGTPEEGKFVALFGRDDRLRAVMAIGRPRQLMGFRPLLQAGSSWADALAHPV